MNQPPDYALQQSRLRASTSMSDPSENQRQQLAELDSRVAQLKAYLASHPAPPATTAPDDSQPEPCWNLISVLAPFFGFALALAALWNFETHGVFMFLLRVTFFGFVAGIIAIYRKEQRPGLAVLGMVLNGIPTIGLVLLLFPSLRS